MTIAQSDTLAEARDAAFERSADAFAMSAMKAMQRAFALPPPPGLTQPQHCLAVISGALAAAAQQGASLANHARNDPAQMKTALLGVIETHFARKIAIETEGQG